MTAAELIPSRGALAVWHRHLLVWRQLFWPSMASNVFEPLLFLTGLDHGRASRKCLIDACASSADSLAGLFARLWRQRTDLAIGQRRHDILLERERRRGDAALVQRHRD